MGKIVYNKGSLFDAAKDKNILVHACNCQGVWGSGIAKEFKTLYKEYFEMYREACDEAKADDRDISGTAQVFSIPTTDFEIGCLFTSYDYGDKKDSELTILRNTELAIRDLLSIARLWKSEGTIQVHSPKINAGLFAVPWDKTEKIIDEAIKDKDVEWTVWTG